MSTCAKVAQVQHDLYASNLEKNKHRFKKNGEVKINDNGLVALALLVAKVTRPKKS